MHLFYKFVMFGDNQFFLNSYHTCMFSISIIDVSKYCCLLIQVAVRSCLLGLGIGLGWFLSVYSPTFSLFGWYIITLSFFHWSEYITISLTNPASLRIDSFLLDHSSAYHVAIVGSLVEFALETYFVPGK